MKKLTEAQKSIVRQLTAHANKMSDLIEEAREEGLDVIFEDGWMYISDGNGGWIDAFDELNGED